MFSNFTKREKLLAGIVGSLVPLVLVFVVLMGFVNSHNLNRSKIASLQSQIDAESQKKLNAAQSNMRRNFHYKVNSLPSDDSRAIIEYRDWLEDMIRDNGLRFVSITDPEKTQVKYKGAGVTTVANKYQYTFTSSGNLEQILEFCYDFEKLDLLHEIVALTIKPIMNRDLLTGQYSVTFKIDVLSLLDADEQRDFLAKRTELPVSFEQYRDRILSRNILGPANNPPTLALSKKSFYQDDEISIPLSGKDIDDDDKLNYEIVDAGKLTGLQIDAAEDGGRATLTGPAQELGEYEVTIRVSDNGFPAKSTETQGTIVIKERPPEKVVEAKPEFKHVSQTQIKRISSRDGIFEVKIAVRTTGQVFELAKGDEFELDNKIWTVRSIDVHSLTLEVDGKLLEFKQGAFLDNPRKETELAKPNIAEVSADSN